MSDADKISHAIAYRQGAELYHAGGDIDACYRAPDGTPYPLDDRISRGSGFFDARDAHRDELDRYAEGE